MKKENATRTLFGQSLCRGLCLLKTWTKKPCSCPAPPTASLKFSDREGMQGTAAYDLFTSAGSLVNNHPSTLPEKKKNYTKNVFIFPDDEE